MTQALVRFLIGGAIVALIPIIAQKMGPMVAGTLLLFPAVSFAGMMFLGIAQGMADIEDASLAAALSLPTVLGFLLAIHLAAKAGYSLQVTLASGVLVWLVVAIPFVLIAYRRQV